MITTDATNLPRLMACNGSRLLPPDPSYATRDDTSRQEGIAAHWLASVVFKGEYQIEELSDRKAPNGIYVTADMIEHTSEYLSKLSSRGLMEWSYGFTGVNGRTDYWDNSYNILRIIDYKYGYSIVEPDENWTLIAHAIGVCVNNGITPASIEFTIFQPRASHRDGQWRTWTITHAELNELYILIQRTLEYPTDQLITGPHCRECPSFAGCVARQDAELNGIEVAHAAYTADISDIELAVRLDQIHRAQELLKQSNKAYEELAMHRVRQGIVIENYALENGLTNRVWKEGVTPEFVHAITGRDFSKRSLPTPKQLELAGCPETVVKALSERRSTGTKLVRIDANKRAMKVFGAK